MNNKNQSYVAFMESVCNKFNCPEAIPALKEGFKAFCEAVNVADQYFQINPATGHTELYDSVLKAIQSKYEVIEDEDCQPGVNNTGVTFKVLVDTEPDSNPVEVHIYDYGYKHDLSYSIRDEYGTNLKDYVCACQGAPLGSQKGYFDINLLISDLMSDLGKLEYEPEENY